MKLTPEMVTLLLKLGGDIFARYQARRGEPVDSLTDAQILARLRGLVIADVDDLLGPLGKVESKKKAKKGGSK